MNQASNYKSIKSFSSPKRHNPHSQIVAQASYTNEQVSSYSFLDSSVKLSEVTLPDSEGATKMSPGRAKGDFLITYVMTSNSRELILSDLTNSHAMYFKSESWQQKDVPPQLLGTLI